MRTNSRWLLLTVSVFGLLAPCAAVELPRRPNIVLIMADDLGYADVGYHGSKYKTPTLDRLAATGVCLESHYVFPMCSPTRAALMTGRYASRFGCTAATNDRVLPFNTVTVARALKSVGYETALVGKWHLGSMPDWGPHKYGFDFTYGSLAGGVGPFDHQYKKGPFARTWHRNGTLIDEEGHVTDLIGREAIRFLDKKRDQPFFLYVPFTAIHVPIDEPKKYLEANGHLTDPGDRLRAACATHMDEVIAEILAALERRKLRENTLVIFLSDNGAHEKIANDGQPYLGKYPSDKVGGSNTPWRGYKTQLYEGGIRTPAIVHWPAQLKPGKRDMPCHVTDWMPTLTALAGYSTDKDLKWDGENIWPLIMKGGEASPRTLYWLGTGRRAQALRHGDWKLIISLKKEELELYNLRDDPGEKNNVALKHPQVVRDLQSKLKEAARQDDDALAKD